MNYVLVYQQELEEKKDRLSQHRKREQECLKYLKNSEFELFDLEHLLEARKHYKLAAPMLTKIALEISDVRTARRNAKNEAAQLKIEIPILESQIKTLGKQIYHLNRTVIQQEKPKFTPRSKVFDRLGITMETVIIDNKTEEK